MTAKISFENKVELNIFIFKSKTVLMLKLETLRVFPLLK